MAIIKIVPFPGPKGEAGSGSADLGDITFDGVKIVGAGTASGDGNNYSTMELVPDSDLYANDQYLIIDPTAPNHIHIRAGGTQDDSNANLILGAELNNIYIEDNARRVSINTRSAAISNSYVNDNMTSSTTFVTSNASDIGTDYVVNVGGTDYVVDSVTSNDPIEGLKSVTASGASFTAGDTYTFTYEPQYTNYWSFNSDGTFSGPAMGSVIMPGVTAPAGSDLYLFSSSDQDVFVANTHTQAQVGYRYYPQVAVSADITGDLSHMNKHIYNISNGQITFTIPTNDTVAFPLGTEIKFANNGSSSWLFDRENTDTMTLVAEGQSYTNENIVFWLPANGIATLLKVETNRWILSGIRVND